MADLLAIVSHRSSEPVPVGELERLAESYEALRGTPTETIDASEDWVHVRVLQRGENATSGIERGSDGWTAWAGSLGLRSAAPSSPLAELDGQFALIRVDHRVETVTIAADPLGMKPLFVAHARGRTYVSSSALSLAHHLRSAPSRLGIETFLRSGMQFGPLTLWDGVERLRPAECLEFSVAGKRRSVYWEPRTLPEAEGLSLAASARLCIERAVDAIASRYDGLRPWMDLTGGFDSRLLALLASRAGIDFTANTIGGRENEDVRLAARIARSAGWPWQQIDLPADWTERLPGLVPEALAWGDGHLDALSLAAVMLGHKEKAGTTTTLLNGGGGEELRDHPWGHELVRAGRSSNVDYDRLLSWRILLPVDLSALRSDPTVEVAAAMRAELEHRVAPFSSHSNVFQNDLLYAYKMTGHSGAYQAAAGAWIDVEMPYYMRPLLSSVISVPPRHRRFHRLMREMIHQLDPAIATIPTETGGPAEPLRPGNLHRFAPYGWRRGRRFATRLRGRLPRLGETSPGGAGSRETALGQFVDGLVISGTLDPARMRSATFYDSMRLGDLFERARSQPAAVDWTALGRVVTVELALQAVDAGL